MATAASFRYRAAGFTDQEIPLGASLTLPTTESGQRRLLGVTLPSWGWVGWRSRRLLSLSVRALLLIAVTSVVVILLLFAPEWLVDFRGVGKGLAGADRVKAVTEERRSILVLLAAVGAGLGLYYTHRRHRLDEDSNRTDRYTRAVEQLGHASPDVQLGGIYASERIALDSRATARLPTPSHGPSGVGLLRCGWGLAHRLRDDADAHHRHLHRLNSRRSPYGA